MLSIMSVGGMVLARALNDETLIVEVMRAARKTPKTLGILE
jgi:hypothetical protein